MADETTVLDNLIDPQVMTAMISAKLPKAIRWAILANKGAEKMWGKEGLL